MIRVFVLKCNRGYVNITSMAMQFEVPVLGEQTTNKRLITGEELAAMSGMESVELVRGEIVYQMPTSHLHGRIEALIAVLLGIYLRANPIGSLLTGEAGVYTRRNPDTVRGVDVAVISNERLQQISSTSYLDIAPELIVEVMSPKDTWSEVNEKLVEYFEIGVQLVWVIDPRRKLAHVYRSPENVAILRIGDVLTGEDILPGLEIPLSEIFPEK